MPQTQTTLSPATSLAPVPVGTDARMSAVAMELAANLQPPLTILRKYAVRRSEWRHWRVSPLFAGLVDDARSRFESLTNTPDRIRMKAQIVAELGIEFMARIIQCPTEPPQARVSAFNAIRPLTGLDKPIEAPVGNRFELKIVLGDTTPPITIEGQLSALLQEEHPEDAGDERETGDSGEDRAGGQEGQGNGQGGYAERHDGQVDAQPDDTGVY